MQNKRLHFNPSQKAAGIYIQNVTRSEVIVNILSTFKKYIALHQGAPTNYGYSTLRYSQAYAH